MNYKTLLYIFLLVFAIFSFSCKKILYGEGNTRVKGQVVDLFTGEPIPDAYVELLGGKTGSFYAPNLIDSFPTDHEGKFDFTFYAKKGADYSVRGSSHKLYRSSPGLYYDLKDGWRNGNVKLQLHPLGWVKVNWKNVPPIDYARLYCHFIEGPTAIITNVDTFLIGALWGGGTSNLACFYTKANITTNIPNDVMVLALDTVQITIEY